MNDNDSLANESSKIEFTIEEMKRAAKRTLAIKETAFSEMLGIWKAQSANIPLILKTPSGHGLYLVMIDKQSLATVAK